MDHRRALADIEDIRTRMAEATVFRGFGPAALAATGILALAVAAVQSAAGSVRQDDPLAFFGVWIAVAVVSVLLVGAEMVVRSNRHHSGMATGMILTAVLRFVPAGCAGAALGAIFCRFVPSEVWMLPGLWQILVGVGVFAAASSLPGGAAVGGAWYLVAGCSVLMLSAPDRAFSPWTMGVPFAVGQLVLAVVVHLSQGASDDR